MATVNDILYKLAVDLNDAAPGHEFTTWSKEQLRGYVIEGCQIISGTKPGWFAKPVVLEFTGCQQYYEICSCTSLDASDVLGQSDAAGNVFQTLKSRPFGLKGRWSGPECEPPPPDRFKLREFSITPDGRSIQLFPKVPPGLTVYVAALCSVIPDDDAMEVPLKVIAPVIQYVLYRAKMVDGENNPAIATIAAKHFEVFTTLVGIKKTSKRKSDGGTIATTGLGNSDDSV
ncbi:MAG: hypothetical protein LBS60_08925 [Deltaproteobacteria bacterium]|jgi:hypothetical protein|nr:hypothetical protein [Deltaproteobacteria bacterium]